MEETRINKYLSQAGYCSRRQADKLIEEKRVQVNGIVVDKGIKVMEGDQVSVDGKLISAQDIQKIYILLNKPVGIVCTTNRKVEKDNIIDFMNYPERIFPVGRLDKRSEGLILLTNDGEIVNKMMRSKNNNEKEYLVTVDKPITSSFIEKMRNGVPILDTITKKCEVVQQNETTFTIVLTQGLNRQIRRMTEYLDYRVVKLKRVRIMHLHLDLPVGKWRYLTASELKTLKKQIDY